MSWLIPALLVVAGAATHAPGLGAPFLYDDAAAIINNPGLRSLAPPWAPPADNPIAGRPVVGFSLALNYAVGAIDPRGYHAVNLAVHLLAGLALYGVVRRTLLCCRTLRDRFAAAAPGLAGAAALLWTVHPLQTECVSYATQRTESVMGLLYLLTLYAAIRARTSPRPWAWDAMAVVACGLGMASKESMVTAPLMVLLHDWAYRDGPFRALARRRLPLYAGLAGTWLVLAALMATAPRAGSVGFAHGVGPLGWALNQCVAVVEYFRLIAWPGAPVIDYGAPRDLALLAVLPQLVIVVAALAAAAVLFARRPAAGYPAIWFFVVLAPTSSVVPIATEVAAERRMYLPLAGLAALLVIGTYALLRRALRGPESARSAPAIAGGVLLAAAAIPLAAAASARHAAYRRPVELWRTAVAARPDNHRAHTNLGIALAEAGRDGEALAAHRRAVEIEPGSALARYNLGNALVRAGRTAEAAAQFRSAVALRPALAEARYALAAALAQLGEVDDAVGHLRELVRRDPDHADAHHDLGRALAASGDPVTGLAHLRRAARLSAGRPDVLRDLAWLLATCPDPDVRDGAEAVRLAGVAADAAPADPRALDVLAAAHAEAGAFERAAATARRAARAAEARGATDHAAGIRRRLAGYRRGEPCRSWSSSRSDAELMQ